MGRIMFEIHYDYNETTKTVPLIQSKDRSNGHRACLKGPDTMHILVCFWVRTEYTTVWQYSDKKSNADVKEDWTLKRIQLLWMKQTRMGDKDECHLNTDDFTEITTHAKNLAPPIRTLNLFMLSILSFRITFIARCLVNTLFLFLTRNWWKQPSISHHFFEHIVVQSFNIF